jgi:hypothetical protein
VLQSVSEIENAPGQPKFFFVHLHKTAGTSLWRRLTHHFDPIETFPWVTDGEPTRRTISVQDLVERWPARRDDVRLLAGHFPLCTREVLGEPFVTLTLLRHPVDRVLSALREQRQKLSEFTDASFEEIYREPMRHLLLRNHMVKMFSLTPASMTDGALTHVDFTREHLDRARHALGTVDHVGFQDDFEAFCTQLSARYGWDLGDPVVDNVSEHEEMPRTLVDLIAEDNAMDIELFDDAQRRYRST